MIAKLVVAHRDEGFTKILLSLLATHGGIDLRKEERPGSSKQLWEEMKTIRHKRNQIVHQGETATRDEAEAGVAVAAFILEDIFPKVIKNLGLHLEGMTVHAHAAVVPTDGHASR